MRTIISFILFFTFTFIYSCGTGQKVTNSWVNKEAFQGQKYNKIFIVALTGNQTARRVVENDLANEASKKGIEIIKSSDIFTQNYSGVKPSKDEMLVKVRELKCDAIFAVSLLDVKSESRYVPGDVIYAPYPSHRYYGGFGAYYSYWAPTVYSPGYYTNDKTYFIEANLFDSNREEILWSVQSESYNPSNLNEFSKGYTNLIFSQLYSDGLLAEK